MKIVIGNILRGSIVAIIVVSFIILMPQQIEFVQEIIKKESIRPCQKAIISDFELYKKNAKFFSSSFTEDDLEEWKNEFTIKEKNIKQLILDNDCEKNPNPDWYDGKFKQDLQNMLDAGF